jgi:PII-like signaling protein
LPIVIEIVDTVERIEAFLPVLDEMVEEGLVMTWDVVVEKYVHGQKA